MPDLCVILPARNAEATITQAVASTLRAMPRDGQLVVLDDGSSDSTAERASAGARIGAHRLDARLKIISGTGSGGVAPALNELLRVTDSRLVGRMDADDVCLPWRFSDTIPRIARGDDLVFSQVIDLVQGVPRPHAPVGIPPMTFPLHLLLTNPASHPSALFTRELIDEVGGYRHVPAEDYDLWLRCAARQASIRRVPAWGLVYRIHPDQVSASVTWRTASWENPLQAVAFADLSEQVVGIRLPRLVSLVGLPKQRQEEELSRFTKVISASINEIGGFDGRFLRIRLQERVSWVRKMSSAERS